MMKIAGKSTSRPPIFFRNLNLVIHIAVHTHARFLPHNFIQFGVILFFRVFLPLFHQAVSTEFISRNTYNFFNSSKLLRNSFDKVYKLNCQASGGPNLKTQSLQKAILKQLSKTTPEIPQQSLQCDTTQLSI